MKKVITKRFELSHVFENDKVLYNTNNYPYSDTEQRPPDYDQRNNLGNTKNWIDLFHKDNYKTLTLDTQDLIWMNKALSIGIHTGEFSHMFDDELEDTCKKYKMPNSEEKYFIRSEKVSLKAGMYGIGPYNSLENIIKSIVTTKLGHMCIHEEDKECKIYFMKWLCIEPEKEFRVFVYQNQITALSIQHMYRVNEWLNAKSDEDITVLINKIIDYFNENIRDKMKYMENYTMDLALLSNDEVPYFIEPNSFGKCYAAGSALFDWIIDHDTLYDSNIIEFRYVDK